MAETFLINIDCSKILNDIGATNYTMFIDSSKMSIVYELVEWIRWMFSLENCISLTHENSVIHELEDIQLLSKLKYFAIVPCGRPHCVHKKGYRDLLKNLNLIVSWNEMKVHKYFLDKINQMSQKLSQDGVKTVDQSTCSRIHEDKDCTVGTSRKFNTEQNKFHFKENQQSEVSSEDLPAEKETQNISHSKSLMSVQSESKTNSYFDKIKTERENLLQLDKNFSLPNVTSNSMNKSLDSEKPDSINVSTPCKDLVNKESKIGQESTKSNYKPKQPRRYTRPFSLGAILTSIREDFDKKNAEQQSNKSTCQDHSLKTEEESSDKETTPFENFSPFEGKIPDRKRQRIRKRKRSKKQIPEEDSFAPYSLEKKKGLCSLNISNSNPNIKPNHIRFDVEDEDYLMESESTAEHNGHEFEISNKELDASTPQFLSSDQGELFSVLNGETQDLQQKSMQSSPEKNKMNAMECSPVPGNQITVEQNVIDLPEESSGNVSQSFSSLENCGVNSFNQDLNELLSLREKFKRGIVIQRFY